MASDQPPIRDTHRRDRPRIETQIHRRKKAKAFSALEPEWDHIGLVPPSHLRMPSGLMAPTPPNARGVPQNTPLQPGKRGQWIKQDPVGLGFAHASCCVDTALLWLIPAPAILLSVIRTRTFGSILQVLCTLAIPVIQR